MTEQASMNFMALRASIKDPLRRMVSVDIISTTLLAGIKGVFRSKHMQLLSADSELKLREACAAIRAADAASVQALPPSRQLPSMEPPPGILNLEFPPELVGAGVIETPLPGLKPQTHSGIIIAIGICTFLLLAVGAMFNSAPSAPNPKVWSTSDAIQPVTLPIVAPVIVATPLPTPAPIVTPIATPAPEVRRATLVPSGQRIDPIGEAWVPGYKWYALPRSVGGGVVKARLLGTVDHFSQIPAYPREGDMCEVLESGNAWVYCTPAGY